MKLITLCLLVGLAFAGEQGTKGAEETKAAEHVAAMKADGTLESVLSLLVKEGTFCTLRGHSWQPHVHVTLEYSPNRIGCRICAACGTHQERVASDWK